MKKVILFVFAVSLFSISCNKQWYVEIGHEGSWVAGISSGDSATSLSVESIIGSNSTNFFYGNDKYIALTVQKMSTNTKELTAVIYTANESSTYDPVGKTEMDSKSVSSSMGMVILSAQR